MPGFITVPYNFEQEDFKNFYEKNRTELHRIKERVNKLFIYS
jgi:hypothetical protein